MNSNRIIELNQIINEASSCPVRTKLYGGLPGGGGYAANTEFEIGAQRIAEAAHCILGSLGKIFTPDKSQGNPRHIERAHIEEEFGIIQNAVKEYSRSLYVERMFSTEEQAIEQHYKAEYADRMVKTAAKSVNSIRTASPKLKAGAKSMKSKVDNDYDKEVNELIHATYDVVITLADEMFKSVKGYPKKTVTDPYGGSKMTSAVKRLGKAVKEMYK